MTTSFGNDAFGRRTARVTPSSAATYTYNATGQLAGVVSPSVRASYSYGVSGMRDAKVVSSGTATTTTTSLWAGMQLVAERESDGTLYRYAYGPGGVPLELSVTTGGASTSYAHQLDHGGSGASSTFTHRSMGRGSISSSASSPKWPEPSCATSGWTPSTS